eukprot:1157777-Pelagomonas_calceolata.AAC.4
MGVMALLRQHQHLHLPLQAAPHAAALCTPSAAAAVAGGEVGGCGVRRCLGGRGACQRWEAQHAQAVCRGGGGGLQSDASGRRAESRRGLCWWWWRQKVGCEQVRGGLRHRKKNGDEEGRGRGASAAEIPPHQSSEAVDRSETEEEWEGRCSGWLRGSSSPTSVMEAALLTGADVA